MGAGYRGCTLLTLPALIRLTLTVIFTLALSANCDVTRRDAADAVMYIIALSQRSTNHVCQERTVGDSEHVHAETLVRVRDKESIGCAAVKRL